MPAAGWLGLGSGPGSGPAPASSLPTTAPQDGLSALLAGVASIEQRQKPPPPSSLGGGSRAMGTGEKTGAATATAIAAASTASSSSPSTAGPASPPPPPPQRQQMLSALLAGLPPEASLSPPFPPPAAAPMEQQQAHPTPGLPGLPVPVVMRDPVAEAVAASREAVFRGIGLLAGQRRLDRGRTEAFLYVLCTIFFPSRTTNAVCVTGRRRSSNNNLNVPPTFLSYSRLLTFLSQAQRRDCSVGVAGLLSHLLHSQPHVFQGTAGPPPPQQAAGIKGQELLQRLAAKEGSCHIIGTPAAAGGDAVVCNVRMVELFVCPQQLSAVLLHTGLASFFMWPLYVGLPVRMRLLKFSEGFSIEPTRGPCAMPDIMDQSSTHTTDSCARGRAWTTCTPPS